MFTTYSQEKLNKHQFNITAYTQPTTFFVSLHTASPGAAGSANEAVAGGYTYARQAVTLVWDTDRVENSGVITWLNLPAMTVTHITLWDAVTAGNALRYGALTTSRVVAAGDNASFAINALTAVLLTS